VRRDTSLDALGNLKPAFAMKGTVTAGNSSQTSDGAAAVLIMSEESRLGRESIETSYLMKQMLDAGVRVFFYLDDRERTLDKPDKVLLSLTNFAAEVSVRKRANAPTMRCP
jgi:acetyl-CoA acetyltransferase